MKQALGCEGLGCEGGHRRTVVSVSRKMILQVVHLPMPLNSIPRSRASSNFFERPPTSSVPKTASSTSSPKYQVWGLRQMLLGSPRFLYRAFACLFSVSLLWATGLSTCFWVKTAFLTGPDLLDVVQAWRYAAVVAQEEQGSFERCTRRQSRVCTSELADYETAHNAVVAATLIANEDRIAEGRRHDASCGEALKDARELIDDWTMRGGQLHFSDRCTRAEQLAAVGTSEDQLVNLAQAIELELLRQQDEAKADAMQVLSQYSEDTGLTSETMEVVVAQLADYVDTRSAYDAAYIESKDRELATASMIISLQAVANGGRAALVRAESFEALGSSWQQFISCTTLRPEDQGPPCPGTEPTARSIFDENTGALTSLLGDAQQGLRSYQSAVDEYLANVMVAQDNAFELFDGVQGLLRVIEGIEDGSILTRLGLSDVFSADWTRLTSVDLIPAQVPWPDVLSLLNEEGGLSANEQWAAMATHVARMARALDQTGLEVTGAAALLLEEQAAAVNASLAAHIPSVQDYAPPQFLTCPEHNVSICTAEVTETHGDLSLDIQLQGEVSIQSVIFGFGSINVTAPEAPPPTSVRPPSFSLSPPPINRAPTGTAAASFTSRQNFRYEELFSEGFDVLGWLRIFSSFTFLPLLVDFAFRSLSTLRLIVRFWNRGGLSIPEADARADKIPDTTSIQRLQARMLVMLTHPATAVTIGLCFFGFILNVVAAAYSPLLHSYRAGCVTHAQNDTLVTANLYTVAYNFAAGAGTAVEGEVLSAHDSSRALRCTNVTSGVGQSVSLQQSQLVELRSMLELKVLEVDGLQRCLDGALTEAAVAEECSQLSLSSAMDPSADTEEFFSMYCAQAAAVTTLSQGLSSPSCSPSVLDDAQIWEAVTDEAATDCRGMPQCVTSCEGPNEELLRAATHHAGCMMEWYLHTTWLGVSFTVFMFCLLTFSRLLLVDGVIRLYWRRMHSGVFTYEGTCNDSGVLVLPPEAQWSEDGKHIDFLRNALEKTLRQFEARAWWLIYAALLVSLPWMIALGVLSQSGSVSYRQRIWARE